MGQQIKIEYFQIRKFLSKKIFLSKKVFFYLKIKFRRTNKHSFRLYLTRRYFKYGSDNGDLGWANWQENEPNNFGNSDERCVGVDLEFWHIRWRQKWFDSGCYVRMAVLCQEDQKLKVAEGETSGK